MNGSTWNLALQIAKIFTSVMEVFCTSNFSIETFQLNVQSESWTEGMRFWIVWACFRGTSLPPEKQLCWAAQTQQPQERNPNTGISAKLSLRTKLFQLTEYSSGSIIRYTLGGLLAWLSWWGEGRWFLHCFQQYWAVGKFHTEDYI